MYIGRRSLVGGHSSVGRVQASQAWCREFESRCPLQFLLLVVPRFFATETLPKFMETAWLVILEYWKVGFLPAFFYLGAILVVSWKV